MSSEVARRRHNIRNSARGRNIEFDLSIADVQAFLNASHCALCKRRFPASCGASNDPFLRTIDRVDASWGYIPGNVQATHACCNSDKNLKTEQTTGPRKRKRISS